MRQGARLASSRAGNDEQWLAGKPSLALLAPYGRRTLLLVQPFEPGGGLQVRHSFALASFEGKRIMPLSCTSIHTTTAQEGCQRSRITGTCNSETDSLEMSVKKTVFRGRVIELTLETVHLPNGAEFELEIIHHPGGAAIVAVDDAQRVCILRQYRHAVGGYIFELPAGKIDHGEPPLETAQRELEEESGHRAARWDSLGNYVTSPGVFTEVVHLYLARDLEAVTAAPEQHEVLEVEWVPFADALAMAANGKISDGKSLVGLFRAAHRFPELLR
jgi:ADP-ribose pyrophosphatase